MGQEIPSILLYSCAIALFLQEVFLVQIAHRKENIEYQERLFSGKVTNTKRLLVMASPFILSMAVGLAMMALNLGSMEFPVVMRIFAVGVIITLGIDPIIGLFDKGPVAMFGAVVIYGIVVNAGLKNYPSLGQFLGKKPPLVSLSGPFLDCSCLPTLVDQVDILPIILSRIPGLGSLFHSHWYPTCRNSKPPIW